MVRNAVQADDLKKAVHEVLGTTASHTLLAGVCSVLDREKDQTSLQKACAKIEKMVALFHGTGKARLIGNRFRAMLA